MNRKLCILHANCQGDALRPLLEASPAFNRHFEIRQYLNYTRADLASEDLERCDLFLHQYLAPAWGDLSSQQLLERLPPKAESICLPNFFFKGYWPFWTNKQAGIDFADSALESLLEKGLSAEAVLRLYLRGEGILFSGMEELIEDSLRREREKETHTPIKYVSFIEENWRGEQLFLTVNHPGIRLLLRLANSILNMLGLETLPGGIESGYIHPQGDFWLPIHPAVGKKFQLAFAGSERKYPCFGRDITHREYVSVYLACRENRVNDLIGVLKDMAMRKSGEN